LVEEEKGKELPAGKEVFIIVRGNGVGASPDAIL